MRQLAFDALSVRKLAKSPDAAERERWWRTWLHIDSRFFISDARHACERAHAQEVEVCNYTIDVVVERVSPRSGRIVYARAAIDDDEPNPGCPELASCLARARLAQELPLPEEERSVYAITQPLQSAVPPQYMLDPYIVVRIIRGYDQAASTAGSCRCASVEMVDGLDC